MIGVAVVVGAALACFVAGWRGETVQHWIGLGVAGAICVVGPVRRCVTSLVERLRELSRRQLNVTTVWVFVLVCLYLFTTAWWQGRDLFPNWHDQQMTLTQAQMLAHFRLWMPEHPCADFFETFYVLVKPVYAPIYFPGAALFYVPGAWLHSPSWVMPLIASGLLAAVLFRVIAEMLDPAAGLLAVFLLVSLWIFRLLSIWSMSHMVFTLLAMWGVWSWLQWRKKFSWGWAVSLGIAVGWMAITRPVDAVAYGVPLGLAVIRDLRRQRLIVWARSLVIMALLGCPFLALQLVQDRGITGHWLKAPIQLYDDQEMPGLAAYGSRSVGDVKITTTLPQKRAYEERFILPTRKAYASQTWGQVFKSRSASLMRFATPSLLLVLLAAVGLLAVRDVRKFVLVAPVFLFLVGYALYSEMLDHYCITVTPGVIFCVVAGVGLASSAFGKWREVAYAGLALGVVGLSLTSLPEARHPRPDSDNSFDDDSWPATTFNYEILPTQVKTPALVLYRYYRPKNGVLEEGNPNDEPVYNVDVPWPDDAPIIRAHDLGARDKEIIEYYAKIQPGRKVYVVDRAESPDLHAEYLGTAGEMAAKLSATSPRR